MDGKGSRPAVKHVKKEDGTEDGGAREELNEDSASSETVKGLLEANRMLKAISDDGLRRHDRTDGRGMP